MNFLGVQIDNNISSVCIHRCSSACFVMVALTGLMTTDTLCFHFTLSLSVSFWGSFGMFKEKTFVGNYISDSLHITLAMITCSHCRQQTNSEIWSVNEP
jgi:hypothetical protein